MYLKKYRFMPCLKTPARLANGTDAYRMRKRENVGKKANRDAFLSMPVLL